MKDVSFIKVMTWFEPTMPNFCFLFALVHKLSSSLPCLKSKTRNPKTNKIIWSNKKKTTTLLPEFLSSLVHAIFKTQTPIVSLLHPQRRKLPPEDSVSSSHSHFLLVQFRPILWVWFNHSNSSLPAHQMFNSLEWWQMAWKLHDFLFQMQWLINPWLSPNHLHAKLIHSNAPYFAMQIIKNHRLWMNQLNHDKASLFIVKFCFVISH